MPSQRSPPLTIGNAVEHVAHCSLVLFTIIDLDGDAAAGRRRLGRVSNPDLGPRSRADSAQQQRRRLRSFCTRRLQKDATDERRHGRERAAVDRELERDSVRVA